MITFDKLYERWIQQIENAASAKDLVIDSKEMRAVSEKALIHVLDIDKDIAKDWFKYYQLESEKIRTGRSSKSQEMLDLKAAAINKAAKISISHAKELKREILGDLAGEYEIGHKEHGPAMDKARLIYDHAVVVDKIGTLRNKVYGITQEQKDILRKIIYAQQAVERAKHTQIARIKKKLGLKGITDKVLIKYLATINEKVELNVDFRIQTQPGGPELRYEVEFESTASNSDSGDLTARLGTKLNFLLNITEQKTMDEFKNSTFVKTLMDVPGSNTFFKEGS